MYFICDTIIPKDKYFRNEHVFDFAEKGTVGRAIFDDDIDSLIELLSTVPVYHLQCTPDEKAVKCLAGELGINYD